MASDLSKWDVLRACLQGAGFDEGDFLPLYTFHSFDRDHDFTNTTYTGSSIFQVVNLRWDDLFPADAVTQVYGHLYMNPGAGESVSVRYYNGEDGETMLEETGITSARQVLLGPVDYTPPTTDARIWTRYEWKTSPGSNTCTIDTPVLVLGVKL